MERFLLRCGALEELANLSAFVCSDYGNFISGAVRTSIGFAIFQFFLIRSLTWMALNSISITVHRAGLHCTRFVPILTNFWLPFNSRWRQTTGEISKTRLEAELRRRRARCEAINISKHRRCWISIFSTHQHIYCKNKLFLSYTSETNLFLGSEINDS